METIGKRLGDFLGLAGCMLLIVCSLAASGQAQQRDEQRTTLVVSPNGNGQGVRVVDQNTGREVMNTNNQVNGRQIEVEGDAGVDVRVVSGLLEWLENKKRKKRPQELPFILPQPPPRPPQVLPFIVPEPPHRQPKIIHIHINNHIQKQHHKKPHHDNQKKHKQGDGYEDYHGGHYDHDKHYHGKHSWPLLSHHFNWDQDYYFGMSGHGNGGSSDDYAGYESKQVASKVAPATATSTSTSTANHQPRRSS